MNCGVIVGLASALFHLPRSAKPGPDDRCAVQRAVARPDRIAISAADDCGTNHRPHDTADVDRPQRNTDRSWPDRAAVLKPYAQNCHVHTLSPC